MNYIKYRNVPFSNLADIKTVLLSAENTCIVDSVNVCNMTNENISMNIELVRLANGEEIRSRMINHELIAGNKSLNVFHSIYTHLENLDSLICFSDGYSQVFDCSICYRELIEDSVTDV